MHIDENGRNSRIELKRVACQNGSVLEWLKPAEPGEFFFLEPLSFSEGRFLLMRSNDNGEVTNARSACD